MRSTSKKGNRALGIIAGCVIAFLGIAGLGSGSIVHRWHAGSPLEGPLGMIGSVLFLVAGLSIIYLVAVEKAEPNDQKQ
jgi:hypothetical protein